MQDIILYCFNSVKYKLQGRVGYFGLFGLDFMVDEDMKVIACMTNEVQHMEHFSLFGIGFMVYQDMKVITGMTNAVQHMEHFGLFGLGLWWTKIWR